MGIFSQRKKKDYAYYFKKGAFKALKELKDKEKANQANNPKILASINKAILALNEEVASFSKALDDVELKYGNHDEAALVGTIFPFLDLSMLDILLSYKQYLNTNDNIERRFICRTAAQHMYEFLEDGSKVLGKQMNSLTENLNDTEINLYINALRKSFNGLKAELHTPLKILRNNVSAHKERNIRNQLAISDGINIIDFQKNFALFLLFFMELIMFKDNFLIKIVKHQNSAIDPTKDNSGTDLLAINIQKRATK